MAEAEATGTPHSEQSLSRKPQRLSSADETVLQVIFTSEHFRTRFHSPLLVSPGN